MNKSLNHGKLSRIAKEERGCDQVFYANVWKYLTGDCACVHWKELIL